MTANLRVMPDEESLGAAGRRALWRLDFRAAEGLLSRSLGLSRPYRLDVPLELDLASAVSASAGRDEAAAVAHQLRHGERPPADARAAGGDGF